MKQEDKENHKSSQKDDRQPFKDIRARLNKPEQEYHFNLIDVIKQGNTARYEKFFLSLINKEYPISEASQRELRNLQQELELTPAEVNIIQTKILQNFQSSQITQFEAVQDEEKTNTNYQITIDKKLLLTIAMILGAIAIGVKAIDRFVLSERSRTANVLETIEQLEPIQLQEYVKNSALSKFITKEAEWINSLTIAPAGDKILIGSRNGKIIIVNLNTGNLIASLTDEAKVDINSILLSPDEKTIITGNDRGLITIWDLEQKKAIHTLRGHAPISILSLAISADGKKLVSGDMTGSIKVWDLDSKEIIHTLLGHSTNINSLAISQDSKRIVSASNDTTIRIWELEKGRQIEMMKDTTEVFAVAISAQNQKIISGNREGTIRIWDLNSGARIQTYKQQLQKISSLALDNQGTILISGSNDRSIVIWNLENGDNKTLNEKQKQYVNNVAISADRKTIVSSSKNEIKIWKANP